MFSTEGLARKFGVLMASSVRTPVGKKALNLKAGMVVHFGDQGRHRTMYDSRHYGLEKS